MPGERLQPGAWAGGTKGTASSKQIAVERTIFVPVGCVISHSHPMGHVYARGGGG